LRQIDLLRSRLAVGWVNEPTKLSIYN